MWSSYMQEEWYKEQRREEEKRIEEEVELEDKIFRIAHPILATLNDLRFELGRKIMGI